MFPERVDEIEVAVGSTNPVKIKATQNVFKRFYKKVAILPFEVSRGVRPQPLGFEEVIKGAVEGARMALQEGNKASFGVGIEAGLVPLPFSSARQGDQHFAAIADRNGVLTIGGGPVFECPPGVTEQILTGGVELGAVMERLSGVAGLGRKHGVVGYLSKTS